MSTQLLILDDDLAVGRAICFIAESLGISVELISHPDEFFLKVDSWQPTHIALDLIMPEMDGMLVLEDLARRDCLAQLIITSGVGTRVLDAAARSARESGISIVGVLPKPFLPAMLRTLLVGKDESAATATTEPAQATAPVAIARARPADASAHEGLSSLD